MAGYSEVRDYLMSFPCVKHGGGASPAEIRHVQNLFGPLPEDLLAFFADLGWAEFDGYEIPGLGNDVPGALSWEFFAGQIHRDVGVPRSLLPVGQRGEFVFCLRAGRRRDFEVVAWVASFGVDQPYDEVRGSWSEFVLAEYGRSRDDPMPLVQRLESGATDGYGSPDIPLPCALDEDVDRLVDVLVGQSGSAQPFGAGPIHGWALLAYVERMAALAVRRRSLGLLGRAAAALCVASRLVPDLRDCLVRLAPVADSAAKLGADLVPLFPSPAPEDAEELMGFVRGFMDRQVADRSLAAFGFVEDEDEGGFRYRSTS